MTGDVIEAGAGQHESGTAARRSKRTSQQRTDAEVWASVSPRIRETGFLLRDPSKLTDEQRDLIAPPDRIQLFIRLLVSTPQHSTSTQEKH